MQFYIKKYGIIFLLLSFLLGCKQTTNSAGERFNEYLGKYSNGSNELVYVDTIDNKLFFRPVFWTSRQVIKPSGIDTFQVVDRKERKAFFTRNKDGKIYALQVTGVDVDEKLYKLKESEYSPIEMIFNGKTEEGVNSLIANNIKLEKLIEIGSRLLFYLPSKSAVAKSYFYYLQEKFPQNSKIYSKAGDACVASGFRDEAISNYEKALELNSSDKNAEESLELLGIIKTPEDNFNLPFTLEQLYKLPDELEIKAAKKYWNSLDLSPQNVKIEFRDKIDLGYEKADLTILSHNVLGDKHYGAVIIPDRIGDEKVPVILESKGVAWYFPPRILDEGTLATNILGSDQGKFIYVIPCFRGEKIIYKDKVFRSEGDSLNSFSSTPSDAIALLNVVIKTFHNIDTSKIIAFGLSRGGTVSLLSAIRDHRINYVLDWTGPTDWFRLMGLQGWTPEEMVKDALRKNRPPRTAGGQTVRRFLKYALMGKETLEEVRQKMIQSSPIYFVDQLPRNIQLHYGLDDYIVPAINGKVLEKKYKEVKKDTSSIKSFYYKNAAHDLDREKAFKISKKYFLSIYNK